MCVRDSTHTHTHTHIQINLLVPITRVALLLAPWQVYDPASVSLNCWSTSNQLFESLMMVCTDGVSIWTVCETEVPFWSHTSVLPPNPPSRLQLISYESPGTKLILRLCSTVRECCSRAQSACFLLWMTFIQAFDYSLLQRLRWWQHAGRARSSSWNLLEVEDRCGNYMYIFLGLWMWCSGTLFIGRSQLSIHLHETAFALSCMIHQMKSIIN